MIQIVFKKFLLRRDTVEERNEIVKIDREEQLEEERNIKKYFTGLHYIDLQPLNPDEFYENEKRKAMKNGPKIPTRKDSQKDAGITLWLKIKSYFSEDARKKRNVLEEKAEEYYKTNLELVMPRKTAYDKRCEQKYTFMRDQLRNGNKNEVIHFMEEVLYSDDFSVDGGTRYEINVSLDYLGNQSQLNVRYRIPNEYEIRVIPRYRQKMSKADEAEFRIDIVKKILLRMVAMVFLSDIDMNIQNVFLIGYLDYFDSSIGTHEQKNVIQFKMNRTLFNKIDLERVRVTDLYEKRIKPKISEKLYLKEPVDLKEIK